jgi:hypothetical protein
VVFKKKVVSSHFTPTSKKLYPTLLAIPIPQRKCFLPLRGLKQEEDFYCQGHVRILSSPALKYLMCRAVVGVKDKNPKEFVYALNFCRFILYYR